MVEGKCHPAGSVVPIKACLQQQPNEPNELAYLTEICGLLWISSNGLTEQKTENTVSDLSVINFISISQGLSQFLSSHRMPSSLKRGKMIN